MDVLTVLILLSSISFWLYGISYFTSPHMKDEFRRFGLQKLGALTVALELSGAAGLMIGLKVPLILLIAAGGLGLLMLLGVAVRIKMKDSIWISLPSLFFMLLNFYIFFRSFPADL